ncbi:GumC family protein [Cytophaga aurantiaca]|uniref:GumC family protein n=1 Tax=Cytophaga aurantiaca TaxID=29530 RepID=UPI0003710F25|nr:polysaccharide biosynthesis tyrosine autokinase [Cytophaga aurantiaca]
MSESEEEKDLINFKEYFRILSKFWYVVVAILLFSLLFSFYKIRYSTPIYMVKTTMHIKDKSSYSYGSKSFLEGSSMFQPFKNLKNEMELIKSYNRIRLVVDELDFTWAYRVKGSLRDIEIYKVQPFEIACDSGLIITNMPMFITIINSEYFTLTVPGGGQRLYDPITNEYVDTVVSVKSLENAEFKFGQSISLGGLFNFKILKTSYYNNSDNGLQFSVVGRDLHSLTREYKAKLIVTENDKSSIITISSSGSIIQKEVAFLNKLSEVYIRKELEDKNQIANNTINFIDSQLKVISDSLNNTGDEIESYRTKNKIYNFEEQSIGIITQLNELEGKKLEAELQLRYYEYLKGYLNTDKELVDLVAPSTINISDVVLNQLVGQLVELYQQKNTLRYSSSEKSPAFQTLLIRVKTTRDALLETTNNLVNTSRSSIKDIDNRIAKMETQMSSIPMQQRTLINIERKHTINDEIYNYLLQKRAEASIARASNLPDAFTVESPLEDDYVQVAPTVSKIYTTYILGGIGVIIVSLIVYGKIDNKIHTKEDIIKFTDVSVLGTVGYTRNDSIEKLVHSGHGSLTESFRSIRTNLQFMLQGKQTFMIGITSCISGDGKSFCSHNLARIYAISGKKTLLVRGDMRKAFNMQANAIPSGSMGLSQYLIGLATLDQIIHDGEINNLYQIIPGPVPPNASELVASERMDDFIKKIKEKFEVVIMDSPPVGLVSDYMSVIKHIDVNLYIVRYDYTPKETLEAIKDLKNKYINKPHAIIFNGITAHLLRKYSYYGNPLEYGYEPEVKEKWWQRFLNFKNKF